MIANIKNVLLVTYISTIGHVVRGTNLCTPGKNDTMETTQYIYCVTLVTNYELSLDGFTLLMLQLTASISPSHGDSRKVFQFCNYSRKCIEIFVPNDI